MTTHIFTFDTYLYRGKHETEVDVEVTYSVNAAGDIELIRVTGVEDTTRDEDDILYDLACDRADADLEEWHQEQAEYRAEAIREERMLRDFQMEYGE